VLEGCDCAVALHHCIARSPHVREVRQLVDVAIRLLEEAGCREEVRDTKARVHRQGRLGKEQQGVGGSLGISAEVPKRRFELRRDAGHGQSDFEHARTHRDAGGAYRPVKLAQEVLPAYEPDDGPLTQEQLAALRRDAKERLAKGEILSRQSLFG